jgi:hypothetical protein
MLSYLLWMFNLGFKIFENFEQNWPQSENLGGRDLKKMISLKAAESDKITFLEKISDF